jgi:hypothetical protein
MVRIRPVALALVALTCLASCATVAEQEVVFHDTQRRYTKLVRFTDWERAGRFVAPDARAQYRADTLSLGDLRFSDYEIQDVQTDGDTATAFVAYTGWRASSPVVVTYVEEQKWEISEGAWVVRPKIAERAP